MWDLRGRRVSGIQYELVQDHSVVISVDRLKPGVYHLQVDAGDRVYFGQFIKR